MCTQNFRSRLLRAPSLSWTSCTRDLKLYSSIWYNISYIISSSLFLNFHSIFALRLKRRKVEEGSPLDFFDGNFSSKNGQTHKKRSSKFLRQSTFGFYVLNYFEPFDRWWQIITSFSEISSENCWNLSLTLCTHYWDYLRINFKLRRRMTCEITTNL